MKIFYNPKTLKIMGMSDGGNSLEFPYIETAENCHSTDGLEIKIVKNIPTLKVKNVKLEDKIKKEYGYLRMRK